MKTLISILLVSAFLLAPANLPQQQSQAQVAPALMVLIVGAGACSFIIYVMNTAQKETHTYILQCKDNGGGWRNIATNTVTVHPDKFYAVFRAWADKNDPKHFYRVIEVQPDQIKSYDLSSGGGCAGEAIAEPYPLPQ
jgi:hypothetical protein